MNNGYKKPDLKSLHYDNEVEKIPSLNGKTIAITGSTSGTGFVAAKTIAKKGARVFLLNRKSDRSKNSYDLLKSYCSEADFVDVECDLQSFDSVKKAARKIADLCKDGLDVLCNNAGVMALKDQATIDGFDIQMQTNHLSHFLLTKELMPKIIEASKKKGEARSTRLERGGEMLPEQATETDNKDEIYRKRYDKMQREFLKTLICDEIIEEHKSKPLGQHSEALERVLYYFRRGAMNDKYVVKCEEPFKKYKIMALSGVRGRSPRLVEDKIYNTVNEAYHGLFLRRVQDLMEA